MTTPASEPANHDTGLAKGSVSAVQVAVVSIAASGPAASVALTFPQMAGFAGKAMVFTLILALVIIVTLTNTFAEFTKRIPSAGSLVAWNSAGLGSNVGFVFGWFFVGGYLMIGATGVAAFGGFTSNFLRDSFGVSVPWWVFSAFCAGYVIVLAWRGVAQTVRSAVILLGIEVGVLLLLALWLVLSGHTAPDPEPFDPGASSGGWPGIGLAIGFGVLAMVGYEEAATLAEEATDSRRSVSRGLWMAGVGTPVFFLVVGYVLVASYGPAKEFAADPLAAETLATRVWGGFGGVVSVVVIVSSLALAQTSLNAGIRVIYSLGQVRLLPAVFARTHPRFRTPGAATVLFSVLVLPLAFVGSALAGPLTLFGYYGFMTAIAFLVVYALTNVALVRYVRRHDRATFSWPRHVLVPLVALAGVLYPLYRTVSPLPDAPYPLLTAVVAGWAGLGVALLVYVRASGKADVDRVARAFAAVGADTPEQDAREEHPAR
ncbi:APC family permease [Pseudonocardia acaciae]|uniref:APC family permease n=1 Tax=Pseudonocardia acaciae TaxID=551276 RepID=UPI000684F176|nr:APC family permease [Pseudonocardia acaciae]